MSPEPAMRSYPRNSPQAAARIVVLAMLADGHLAKAELELLERLGVARQLGLPEAELHAVLHAFCEDLLASAHLTWADACRIDPRTLAGLMAVVDDPALRRTVLNLCVAVAEADQQVDEAESIVLATAVEQWGLHREMFETEATSG